MQSYALTTIFLLLAAFSTPAVGQQPKFQNNVNFGAGFRHNKMSCVPKVQPAIPINLSEEWNLINGIVMPITNQPNLAPSSGGLAPSTMGTGFDDFNPTFFLSPAKPGRLIWGLGPAFALPTATDRNLGSGKWSMGPWSKARWTKKLKLTVTSTGKTKAKQD